eukprot:TRINITY_DN23223_c0_g1_i1.p1 TRINITY_DN23223_c0_g1~~TRINITY_DN23223_c0_g1_i1.p1  ORF type:complete len:313 (-),score=53.25 TRINITY_DN23223_c0_g1_i1:60-998(-)
MPSRSSQIRIRLELSPPLHLPWKDHPYKTLFAVQPGTRLIADLTYAIISEFQLRDQCPHGIALSVDGFALPPSQPIMILEDDEVVRVVRAWSSPARKRKRDTILKPAVLDGSESAIQSQPDKGQESSSSSASSSDLSESEHLSQEQSPPNTKSKPVKSKPAKSKPAKLKPVKPKPAKPKPVTNTAPRPGKETRAVGGREQELSHTVPRAAGHVFKKAPGQSTPVVSRHIRFDEAVDKQLEPGSEAVTDYEQCVQLGPERTPSIGQRVAFKQLKIGPDFTPQVSGFKSAVVLQADAATPVSYTHLTLPTKRIV